MAIRVAVAAVGLCCLAGGADARCQHSGYRIVPSKSDSATVEMLASNGRDCVIRLTATRRFAVTGRRIAEEPRFGKVSIEGETAFYRAFPGYTGPDRFVAQVSARGTDGEGTSTIVVNVIVD